MIYDDYLDLRNMDLLPFIDQDDASKSVNQVILPIQNMEGSVLCLWVQCEKDGFYFYMGIITKEICGISMRSDDIKKILLMPKYGRGSRNVYYSAGMKAALFAKDMLQTMMPQLNIDWSRKAVFPKRMSEKPLGVWQDVFAENCSYYFDEKKIWNQGAGVA